MPASTFAELLAEQLVRAPGRPLVTWYDDRSGERVELSVATFANWVAKTAGLLRDELGIERGATVRLDLPPHWLGPVWLAAVWSMGAAVTVGDARPFDAVACGPASVDRHAAGPAPVVALSLLPMAARFARPVQDGVLDYGVAVWGQPDGFWPDEPPTSEDLAWHGDAPWSQADLLAAAASSELSVLGTRLLTDLDPCSAAGLVALVAPLAAGGGTVWVSHPDPEGWERRAEAERVTHSLRQPTRS